MYIYIYTHTHIVDCIHLYTYIYEINHDLPWNNNIVLHN